MLIFEYSHYFLPRYSHFSICATVPQVAQVADNRNDCIWIVGNNFKHICVVIYLKTLLFQVIYCRYQYVADILVQCATFGTN